MLLALGPAAAAAQTAGINLWWDDCGLGAPRMDMAFACNTNVWPPDRLVVSIANSTEIDGVIGAEGSIVLQVDGPVIPDFWRLDAAGCRSGLMLADAEVGVTELPYACSAPWGQASTRGAFASFHPWTVCGPHKATILWSVMVPEPVTFPAESESYVVRLALLKDRTTTCSGCTMPACLVAPQVVLRRAADDPRGDVTLSQAAMSQHVTWQGGGATFCPDGIYECPVPARASTWGQIKSMYR